jgi:hypothetical protein
VTRAKGLGLIVRSLSQDYLGGHVSAGKNPVVDGATDDGAVGAVEPAIDDAALEPALDPELDRVPLEDTEADTEGEAPTRRGRGPKVIVGAVLALVIAGGAVWAAGTLGGSSESGLPQSVSDPAVVLNALEEAGISCTGAAISGDVATCNASIAVRLFASPEEAEALVDGLLKDPLTSSAIGWVRNGNAVVAAPLNAAPDVAGALGSEARIY